MLSPVASSGVGPLAVIPRRERNMPRDTVAQMAR